ncbi:MAG: flagellar biosynthetic protein FliR [Bryobacteraceae bacterium]
MTLSQETLFGFLLALARVGGVFTLVPLPQIKNSPPAARILFTFILTFALQPMWPTSKQAPSNVLSLLVAILPEAFLGITIGVAVTLLLECFSLAAHILGVQAGYGYATTIDPSSQADSGVLSVLAQLGAWLMFVVSGMDQQVFRALAHSFEVFPPGGFILSPEGRAAVLSLGSAVFATALRLALPIVALLLLVDVAFAVTGKLSAQLQLLSLAFPVKMLVTLLALASGFGVFPRLYESLAAQTAGALMRVAGS